MVFSKYHAKIGKGSWFKIIKPSNDIDPHLSLVSNLDMKFCHFCTNFGTPMEIIFLLSGPKKVRLGQLTGEFMELLLGDVYRGTTV